LSLAKQFSGLLLTKALRVAVLTIIPLGLASFAFGASLAFSNPPSGTVYLGDVGVAYTLITVSATGGTPPYTYSTIGAPSWVSVNSSTGVATATPSTPGAYTFTLKVVDHAGASQTEPQTIDVAPDVSILTASLPSAQAGLLYYAQLQAAGGYPSLGFSNTYSWSVVSGSLPPGLSLTSSGSTNSITGTPSAGGLYNFTLQVTDALAGSTASANLSILVSGQSLTFLTPPSGTVYGGDVGVSYTPLFSMSATGGTPPYTYSTIGAPSWVSVNSSTGTATGTPTTTGTFTFTLKVVDHAGASQTQSLTFDVAPDVSILTASLPNAQLGAAYSVTLQAAGGLPTFPVFTYHYIWSVASGSLPPGLSLTSSGSTTTITGTPSITGFYSFTMQVTDSDGSWAGTTASTNLSIIVPVPTTIFATPAFYSFAYSLGGSVPPAQTISVGSTNPSSGVNFNASTSGGSWLSLSPTGGTTPASVSISLNPSGLAQGTYNGVVTVSSASAASLAVRVTLTVSAGATISATPGSLAFNYSLGDSVPPAQTISVGSSGAPLSFDASVSVSNGNNWLFISPAGTLTAPTTLAVSVFPTGLAAGTYKGAVNLVVAGASNSPQAVNVSLTITASPALTVQKTHSGVFSQGQAGSYTITVNNSATGGPTSGTVSVTDTLPSGLTLVSMAGPGWSCVGATCTRGDPLAPGSSYPSITVTVDVTSNAASQVTNQVSVSGGGSAPASTSDVTSIASSSLPVISSIANAAGEGSAVAQNTWIEVKGINLAPHTRTWQTSDFVNNQLPTQLDGVSVMVNGKSAYVYYISSVQVNVLTPLDSAQGLVQVQLTDNGSVSAAFTRQLQSYAPGLFQFSGTSYVAATHANGSLLGPASLYPGSTTPATPGEVVTFYGNGFGQTSPPLVSGSETQTGILPAQPVVKIGGISATVQYAGVVAPGLYQLNVMVPPSVPAGDAALVATYNGVSSNTATIAVAAASAPATLTSINPSSSATGKILTVVIAGLNTSFVQGQTVASFGPGISVGGSSLGQAGTVTVTGPTSATAQVTIDPSAVLGARSVTVTTATQTASLNNAFTVLAPPTPLGPLSITSTLPANGATGVSMTPSIQITFNEPLDSATIGPSTFTLANSRASLPVTINSDSTGMIVTLTPSGALTPNGTYSVTIGSQVRNAAESPLGNPFTFSFMIVPPSTVNGSLTVPAGLDPTTLMVLSFGGNVTTPSTSGGFSASVSPLGNSFVAAMLPGKAFGFLAVTTAGPSANPNLTADPMAQTNTAASRVHKTRWQLTASPAATSAQNDLVADFQTTAEALLFITPYLFTQDPQKAQVILSAIASNAATAQLAQALTQSWNEADPLGDSLVQSTFQDAVLAVVQALGQQTPAQSISMGRGSYPQELREPSSVARSETNSTASASTTPATVTVTPYCWPSLTGSTPGLPCLDLDFLNFQGSTSVDANTGNYGFSPQNCFQVPGGCAVSWLARITPIGVDPNSIVAGSDSFGPESPIVSGEPAACSSPCSAAWIAGNSAFQYLDVLQDVITGASVEWQRLGLPNLLATGPSFVLQAKDNQVTYIVRAYSGGLADFDEAENVLHSKYPDALQFGSAALGINLIQEVVDFINFSTLGASETSGVTNFFTCELTDLVTDFVAGAGVEANTSTTNGIFNEYGTILTSALGQTLSCAADAGLQAFIKLVIEAGGALSEVGVALDTASQVGSAAASGGDAIQRIYQLGQKATAVETAIINIAPGSAGIVNPVPSITSLSPTSATAGSASLSLTIGGNYFLSNSVVTLNGAPRSASLTPTGNLAITLTPSDLATPGTFSIVVTNPAPGGGASNPVNFTVQPSAQNPQPAITSLSPASALAGSGPLTLTINGSGFIASSSVTVNGVSHTSTFVSANQLTITLGAPELANPGTLSVVVTNPPPGGGSSQAAAFTVQPSIIAPTLLSLTLSTTSVVGGNSLTGTVTLASAAPTGGVQVTLSSNNSSVQVPQAPVTIASGQSTGTFVINTTTVASTQTATITASLGTSNGTAVLTVSPGGSSPAGTITTVAGGGSSLGDNGPATSAQLVDPFGVAVDSAGSVYIGDSLNNRIRKVTNGVITTVAGNGTPGFSGDNGPATSAQLDRPHGVAVDPAGSIYVADSSNNCIRKVTNGVITTVAGNGTAGLSGDNGPATSAQLQGPSGVAVDSAGSIYIADTYNNRIRKVTNGVITTVAGSGIGGGFSGDNGPATGAMLAFPFGVSVDSAGNIYIADNGNNRIRKVTNGMIATVAGNGTQGFSGDNGPATSAELNAPYGVAVDSVGNLYIADLNNVRIRKVTNGVITTVAGNGTQGFSGDNGPATSAHLDTPEGIAVDYAGNIYIADTASSRIRLVFAIQSPTTATLVGLSLTLATVTGGTSTTGTVSLSGAAPSGGIQISLSSNNSSVQVPATVSIAAGQNSATFTITTTAVTSTQAVTVTATSGTVHLSVNLTVTPASGGISVQGKSFTINGTMTMSGKALGFEIQTLATSGTAYFVLLDNDISATSGISFEEEFDSGVSVSGNTAVFSGSSLVGTYININANGNLLSITSTTLTINFTSSAPGSAVTGTVSFSTSSGTIQGTFTGTLASPGFS
jgi:uncharacterized protein (TIGR03437 family)